MPGFDGTGPRGMGPMTGGGRGFCSPYGFGGGFGRGYGFRMGMPYPVGGQWSGAPAPGAYGSPAAMPYGYPYGGAPYAGAAYPGAMPYGYGGAPMGTMPGPPTGAAGANPYAPQMTREQELDLLRSQAEAIKGQLEQIDARIKELGTEE